MLTFHPLTLRRRYPVAADAVCLEFDPPAGLAERYHFEAGQHLAVRAMVDGQELRRTYSIASPADGALRIGVRVQGAMSRYLAETLAVGETLEALPPTGRFRPTADHDAGALYVALAAGSGITPVLSIVATLLATRPSSRVLLIYGNRSTGHAMFLEEVLALKDRYLDRLRLHFVMSREPQEVELFNGRLDGGKIRALAATVFTAADVAEYFVCGPGSMVREATATLKELGATGKIHVERFAADAGGVLKVATAPVASADARDSVEVTVLLDGRRRSFRMAPEGQILDAAEAAGLALPYSCRAGVCSTCRTRVVAGSVAMERNQALEEWEVAAGFVLSCQARPTSDRVELSYDDK